MTTQTRFATAKPQGKRLHQSRYHRPGSQSYHSLGVFTGQLFGFFSWAEILKLFGTAGLSDPNRGHRPGLQVDHLEISSWNWDLTRAATDEGAVALAREILGEVKAAGIKAVRSVSTHLQGQVLGDPASAVTLQFTNGRPLEAYREFRASATAAKALRRDPFYVPEEVGDEMRTWAVEQLKAAGRLAYYLGLLQGLWVPTTSFTGAPGRLWQYGVYQFPGIPGEVAGQPLFAPKLTGTGLDKLIAYAGEQLLELFGPVWQFYDSFAQRDDPQEDWVVKDASQDPEEAKAGLKFEKSWAHGKPVGAAYEDHPTEYAVGDPISGRRLITLTHEQGGHRCVGFNFDNSHKEWNNVDGVSWWHELGEHVLAMHLKGVDKKGGRYTRGGVLGAFLPMAHPDKTMHFVYALSDRDGSNTERLLVAANQNGFRGGVTIELEDNDFELGDCARVALARTREIDLWPTLGAFDRFAGAE